MAKMNLGIFQSRIEELAESPDLLSLRQELGLTRVLLEQRLTFCKTSQDLILHTPAIQQLVRDISALALTMLKLETILGSTLSKDQLMQMSSAIGAACVKHNAPAALNDEIFAILSGLLEEKSDVHNNTV